MKRILLSLMCYTVLVTVAPALAGAERTLYSVSSSPIDNLLRVDNPLTGATIASRTITLSGATVIAANGLARDPTTGRLWALLQLSGQFGRELVTINPATGAATPIGNTGDLFAGLAFISNGTLYGVTGDGAITPSAVFTLNKTNATPTFVIARGVGDDGEAIGFNPNDGLLYHASGLVTQIFESINPNTLAVTSIPQSGATHGEVRALTHLQGNLLLMTDAGNLYTITTGGAVTLLGAIAVFSKGLAFVPKPPTDFDADVKNDISIYRNGVWFILRSSDGVLTSVGLGAASGDVPVSADYDGDGKVDQAVFRNGLWFILQSSNGVLNTVGLGTTGDVPVPADYDGDGKADEAVFRNGLWFIRQSSNGALITVGLGTTGDVPVPADYDGDGKVDQAVFRNGLWFILQSSNGMLNTVGLGTTGDVPVPADYDGDGKADPAVYRNGLWFIRQSSNGVLNTVGLGAASGDVPVPADYDGDGKADEAVFRNGLWFILQSSDGALNTQGLGTTGDVPLN